MIPCILFEDDHLLVAAKPAGMNTHSPSPHAGEGLYEWLRHREPRWATLSILHRLDKETSGVMIFGRTAAANRSLSRQFESRAVRKTYLLAAARPLPKPELVVKSRIARSNERYLSRADGAPAETRFRASRLHPPAPGMFLIEAEPFTGRTHQIRVHASENGFPILGDAVYGGAPFGRVCLHAARLELRHPVTGRALVFEAPVDFTADIHAALRAALVDAAETDAYRLIHGAADNAPGWYVDRLGGFVLSQSESPPAPPQLARLAGLAGIKGLYHKNLQRQVRKLDPAQSSPQKVSGDSAPARFEIRENGVKYEASFEEGYSVGLFLDQRDNRRRLMTRHIAAGFPLREPAAQASGWEVLNTFAYTCAFSVCAALAGARVTSLDLSRKYLDWGRRNFELNGLDPAGHEFIYGDAFDWFRRLAKKGRQFDAVLLDPPTFSQSKEHGVFQAARDYGRLVEAALPLVAPRGILFASTNAADWPPADFVKAVEQAIARSGRRVLQSHYAPQPPDFPMTRAEPGHLKTLWMRVG
ncbi:MAG: class I SAM-dependent methyltransferase [Verrucomicrobiota bacterium]